MITGGEAIHFRMTRWMMSVLVATIFVTSHALAAPDFKPHGPQLDGEVSRLEPGLTLVLKDGRSLVLAGVWPLRRMHDGGDGVEDALAIMAKNKLEQLASISFFLSTSDPDRYDRFKAHILDGQDRWLSLTLLEEGLAYAFPVGESPEHAAALYAAEDKARARNKGLWAHPLLAAQPSKAVTTRPGTFAVIKGPVIGATKVAGTVYLNFDDDWREDFTIRLVWPLRRQYPKAQRTAEWWQGRDIEVRGVLESFNGPMITPLHPAQIRLISNPQGSTLSP